MPRLLLKLCASLVILFHVAGATRAQERPLLYSKSSSEAMDGFIKSIRNPQRDPIPVELLPPPSRYFVRIAPRKDVVSAPNQIKSDAFLARSTKAFVFLTTPEGIYGKTLLEIYADIGYEAEDIIRYQRDQDMVAIVFRYPNDISLSNVRDGNLDNDWSNRIYRTTWDNILSLFSRLVQDNQTAACTNPPVPATRICLPTPQAQFVSGFPLEGKLRVKATEYRVLQGIGGADWTYRKLLEDSLSVFEHFRGDGRTENELFEFRDKPIPGRLKEVVAPNRNVSQMPEVAVIGLGKLVIEDCYSPAAKELLKCVDK